MSDRRRDSDPAVAASIDAIMGASRKPMPKPPADALIVFRCRHDDGRAALIGWVARGQDALVATIRDRIGRTAPGWSTSKVTPFLLDDWRQHGRNAHCGDHAHWLEGSDWSLPKPGFPGRTVIKDPGIH